MRSDVLASARWQHSAGPSRYGRRVSGQRARSVVDADHRSAHPDLPGLPWWGAVLLAVTATAMGFAFDAGSGEKELSIVFAGCYAVGCILAVLAVRQAGVFSAVIQPPLILFVAVPGAYFLFQGGRLTSVKDTLINCGYPLIERFPLMFFTSATVLLIGMARWYYAMSTKRAAPKTTASAGVLAAVTSKVSSLMGRPAADESEPGEPRRKRTSKRPARAATATKSANAGETTRVPRKATKRAAPSRSRHARPPEPDLIDPAAERPRRPRPSRRSEPPSVDEPRWRPRSQAPREPGKPPPVDRRAAYERARRRVDDFEPFEPRDAASNGTHHPISRVRYRTTEDGDARAQYRTRPRSRREADAWEYDA